MKLSTDEDGFIQITIPQGSYEIESFTKEIKRIIKNDELFTEGNYPITIKPNFSTLGSIKKIAPQGPIISFMFKDSIKDLLGFHATTLFEEYNLSSNLVDILSFDKIFLETEIAQRMLFKGKRSKIIHVFLWMSILGISILKNSQEEYNRT